MEDIETTTMVTALRSLILCISDDEADYPDWNYYRQIQAACERGRRALIHAGEPDIFEVHGKEKKDGE